LALAIATNYAALKAAISATQSNKGMETSMVRLSTGKRINSASDDAAGVAIASRLSSEIRGTDQAIRNALDGQALINTAEGAHQEIESILQRMREVSVQAANDTNNQQDRDNLQAELKALSTEVDRIAITTTWAGTNLLNGDGSGGHGTSASFGLQVGTQISDADRISVQIGAMTTEALGFDSTAAVAGVAQIGGNAQAVTISGGTNSTASGSVFSLDTQTITTGGDTQAVTIAAGTQTTAAGSLITLNAGTTTTSTDTVTHVAMTTAITGATASAPETTVTNTTTKVHTGTGGTAEDPTIAGGTQTTTTGNVISLDLNTPTEFTPTKAGAEFQVNTFTNGNQAQPSVTMLSDGGFLATWWSEGQDDTVGTYTYDTRGVFGQRFDASGNPVGSEFLINTTVANQQGSPAATSLSDGGFVVTWESKYQDGSLHGIYGQRYDASGSTVGSEFQVNTYTSSYQATADITSLSDGGFVVTWQSSYQDGDEYGIYGQKYDSSGNVAGSEFQISTSTTGRQEKSQVTALLDGGFVVTWQSPHQGGSDYDIYGQRYDQYGNTVNSEFIINAETNDEQQFPSISSLADGDFVATWASYDQDGSEYGVYGQRFEASGAPTGSEFQVNTYTTSHQANPSITSLPDGGYLIVWNSYGQDGQASGVYGQRYNAEGNATGSEFQVNTGDANSPSYDGYKEWDKPSISADPEGNFVVTWAAKDQEGSGSGYGVFGQRFTPSMETALASNASVVVNGKTLTFDLSSHHNGSVNDHYGAAAAIASAINNDSDLQTAGYHATAATVDQVNAGTHAAGDVIITRAHIPDETVTTDTTSTTTTAGAASIMTPTKLGTEFQVNTHANGEQRAPVVGNLANGGFVVAWGDQSNADGSGNGVFGQMYDASGNTVGSEFQINTHTNSNQRYPSISGLSNGGFVVTWHSKYQDGDDDGVFGQRYDASGQASGSEFQINTHTTSYQQFSSVTSLSDGGFVVTWHSDQDGGWGVYGQKFDSSGNASGAEFKINSTSTNYLLYPSVSGFSDGGFIATWYGHGDKDTNGDGVYGQRYDQYGNTVGSEFLINTETSGNQIQPAVTTLSNGGFVATWTSAGQDASGEGVYVQRYSASGEKDGSEFRVNTYQNGNERYSEVTSLTDGGYVVTWYSNTHTDDTNYGVHGQRFDASGTAIGSQFLVNATTTNAQIYPMIASLADSGFVVTWQSYLQDGSNYGIFAQRFASPIPSGTITATDHTVSTVTSSSTGETPFGSDVSFGVAGKTLTLDLSAHHDGSNNDYYGAAEAIAAAINGDSDLQALGYSAAAATLAQVNAGTYAAGDIIITRADTPTNTTTTLVGNAASFVVEGITVNTDLSAYSADFSGAAAAVASDINANTDLLALGYTATADSGNSGDIIIFRADTSITQAYVAAIPATTAMSLTTGDNARNAIAKIDTAIKAVNTQRSSLGAISNRLSHTVNNLTNVSSNLSAAKGAIENADFAYETTNLAKNQILQQASTAMLAQANASKQNVLTLLQG
jgi:flagellin-like hook-associated protein FlgL